MISGKNVEFSKKNYWGLDQDSWGSPRGLGWG